MKNGCGGLSLILRYCNVDVTALRSMKIDNELWWAMKNTQTGKGLAWELSDFPLGQDHIAR